MTEDKNSLSIDDHWVKKASEHFNIPVSSVTRTQRSFVKHFYSGETYGMGGSALAK